MSKVAGVKKATACVESRKESGKSVSADPDRQKRNVRGANKNNHFVIGCDQIVEIKRNKKIRTDLAVPRVIT